MGKRIAGFFELKHNGTTLSARGTFTINLGRPKRDGVVSSRSVDGFTEVVQIPSCKGMITDFDNLHVIDDILEMTDATVTIKAGNGKTYMIEDAWFSADGEVDVEKGTVQFECQGLGAEEMG